MLLWLTLFPVSGVLPVTAQTFDIEAEIHDGAKYSGKPWVWQGGTVELIGAGGMVQLATDQSPP